MHRVWGRPEPNRGAGPVVSLLHPPGAAARESLIEVLL